MTQVLVVAALVATVAAETCPVDSDFSYLGDGYCDAGLFFFNLNTDACGWDKGDCCPSTCEVGYFDCVSASCRYCTDPTAPEPCVDDDYYNSYYSDYYSSDTSHFGDGICDDDLNSETCNWDGGDCCQSTCEGSYLCGFNNCTRCLDPAEQPCVYACDSTTNSWVGDGYCDDFDGLDLNTELCGYDGGDCCPGTCRPSDGYVCGYTYCSSCDDPAEQPCADSCSNSAVGDGFCDDWGGLNRASCNWDGGDCCPGTCQPGTNDTCGNANCADCIDPNAEQPCALSCSSSFVNDGYCDNANGLNNAKCNWDGGDCCPGTCFPSEYYFCRAAACDVCLDPEAQEPCVRFVFPRKNSRGCR